MRTILKGVETTRELEFHNEIDLKRDKSISKIQSSEPSKGSGREDRKFSPEFLDCTQLQYSGTQLHDIALGYNLLPTTWLVLGYNCSVFRREIAYYKVNFQKFRLRRYLQYIFDSRIATAPSINVKTKIWARRRRKNRIFGPPKSLICKGNRWKRGPRIWLDSQIVLGSSLSSDCTWVKWALGLGSYLGQIGSQIVFGSSLSCQIVLGIKCSDLPNRTQVLNPPSFSRRFDSKGGGLSSWVCTDDLY